MVRRHPEIAEREDIAEGVERAGEERRKTGNIIASEVMTDTDVHERSDETYGEVRFYSQRHCRSDHVFLYQKPLAWSVTL